MIDTTVSPKRLEHQYPFDFVFFFIVLYNRYSFLHKRVEAFPDGLRVIVHPAACLSALDQSFFHHCFTAFEEQYKMAFCYLKKSVAIIDYHLM